MNGKYEIGDYVLSNWKLVKELGEGAFGKVYEAHREEFGVTYKAAIKIISIPQTQGELKNAEAEGMTKEEVSVYFEDVMKQIVSECAFMSKVKGITNIVGYEDHVVIPHEGTIGWDVIIRMELLTPLLQYVKLHEMTPTDTAKLGADVCRALEVCRKMNIIHRDVKPENIMISDIGKFKLGDFGISRTLEATQTGLSKKGTVSYMAPEVAKGEPYGPTVDIYSLGIVMYRFLNHNRLPFLPEPPAMITFRDRENANQRRMIGEELPMPKDADKELGRIVRKACAYAPGDRYESPALLRKDLETWLKKNGVDLYQEDSVDAISAMEPEETLLITPGGMQSQESFGLGRPQEGSSKGETSLQKSTPTKGSGSKKKTWAIILGAVAAVLLLGIGIYLGTRGGNGKDDPGESQVSAPTELAGSEEPAESPEDEASEASGQEASAQDEPEPSPQESEEPIPEVVNYVGKVIFDTNAMKYLVDPEENLGYSDLTGLYELETTTANREGKIYCGYYDYDDCRKTGSNGAYQTDSKVIYCKYGTAWPTVSHKTYDSVVGNCFLGWNASADGKGIWYSQNGSGDGSGKNPSNTKKLILSEILQEYGVSTIRLYAICSEVTWIDRYYSYVQPKLDGETGLESKNNVLNVAGEETLGHEEMSGWSNKVVYRIWGTGLTTMAGTYVQTYKTMDDAQTIATVTTYPGSYQGHAKDLTTTESATESISTKEYDYEISRKGMEKTLGTNATEGGVNKPIDALIQYQGTIKVYSNVYARQYEKDMVSYQQGWGPNAYANGTISANLISTIRVDLTPPALFDAKVKMDGSKKNLTINVKVSDRNDKSYGEFTYENDSAGIYGVYVKVSSALESKTYPLSQSTRLEGTRYNDHDLVSSWTDKIEIEKDFPGATELTYEIYAVDYAGNLGSITGSVK